MAERNLSGLIVLEAGKSMKMAVAFDEDFILLCVMTEGWKGKWACLKEIKGLEPYFITTTVMVANPVHENWHSSVRASLISPITSWYHYTGTCSICLPCWYNKLQWIAWTKTIEGRVFTLVHCSSVLSTVMMKAWWQEPEVVGHHASIGSGGQRKRRLVSAQLVFSFLFSQGLESMQVFCPQLKWNFLPQSIYLI